MEEEKYGKKGQEAQCSREEIDVDISLIAYYRTQWVDKTFTGKGSYIDHHIENGISFGSGF